MSVYETTYDKIGMLSVAFGKEKSDLMHELINAVFKQYEKAVAQSVKNGKASFFYTFDITNEDRILVAPKLTVHTRKSKPIVAKFSKEGKFKGVVE